MADHIEAAQKMMLDWGEGRYSFVPNDVNKASKRIGTSEETQEVLDGRHDFGSGISLINDRAIVVDTPLNCLRMMRWRDTVVGSELRLKANNPDRWQGFWLPHISLLDEALNDFPRSTRKAALAIADQHRFFFPEPT